MCECVCMSEAALTGKLVVQIDRRRASLILTQSLSLCSHHCTGHSMRSVASRVISSFRLASLRFCSGPKTNFPRFSGWEFRCQVADSGTVYSAPLSGSYDGSRCHSIFASSNRALQQSSSSLEATKQYKRIILEELRCSYRYSGGDD